MVAALIGMEGTLLSANNLASRLLIKVRSYPVFSLVDTPQIEFISASVRTILSAARK